MLKKIAIGVAMIAALTTACVIEEPSNTPQEVQTTSDQEDGSSDRPKETVNTDQPSHQHFRR